MVSLYSPGRPGTPCVARISLGLPQSVSTGLSMVRTTMPGSGLTWPLHTLLSPPNPNPTQWVTVLMPTTECFEEAHIWNSKDRGTRL